MKITLTIEFDPNELKSDQLSVTVEPEGVEEVKKSPRRKSTFEKAHEAEKGS